MPIYMKIIKATAKNKKWKALFSKDIDGERKIIKMTSFGDSRYQDYTQHKDKERRSRYRSRHMKDLTKGELYECWLFIILSLVGGIGGIKY